MAPVVLDLKEFAQPPFKIPKLKRKTAKCEWTEDDFRPDFSYFLTPEELQDEELRRSPDLLELYDDLPKPSLTATRETVPLKTLRVSLVKLESGRDARKQPTLLRGGNIAGAAKAKPRAPTTKRAVIPKLPEKPLTDPKKVAALRRTLLLPKTKQRTVRCLPRFPYWRHWSEIA
ncbi:uncharacterized protein LOC122372720 [Amphibalanus amphitrite]|uniref:uncharacterized protein LOC122372720 n=1 Tax=Amphibalanus amphitrite TaxID=1232801 RepID=UPI001C91DA67|nr:uncharacterized protein LOC122372720 [Amphibalanus amphitrite]